MLTREMRLNSLMNASDILWKLIVEVADKYNNTLNLTYDEKMQRDDYRILSHAITFVEDQIERITNYMKEHRS